MSSTQQPRKDDQQGIQESQQDRKQDETAKQRPGPHDQQVHDANTRRPTRQDQAPE